MYFVFKKLFSEDLGKQNKIIILTGTHQKLFKCFLPKRGKNKVRVCVITDEVLDLTGLTGAECQIGYWKVKSG